MLSLLKRNLFIIIIFIISLSLAFITFLTFLDKSFIKLNEDNLQLLLISNIFLTAFFFLLIFIDIKSSIKNNINVKGSIANRKYIISFAIFTLLPSLLIAIFSLFLFYFGLEKFFDKKITSAVNNSYEIAKNYVEEKQNKIKSEIVLIAYDLNNYVNIYDSNIDRFKNILNTQKIIRDIDQIHLIDVKGNLLLSSINSPYKKVDDKAIQMVLNDDRPLKIINAFENKSAALIRLKNYENTLLYVVKFLDKNISNYLTDSEEAINFYYTVDNQSLGIRISFAIMYLVLVTLLLFLSITIAIRFSSRFFISINNLIIASQKIGQGNLDSKVPEVKADKEMESLNKNFNLMIERLKTQQEKLLTSERHEAWENVARKLAHEIKNPLTPIHLSIDNLNSKYLPNINPDKAEKFKHSLNTILKQIKQIENLVNEFSDFARMPKPLLKGNNLNLLIQENINLVNKLDDGINIKLISHLKKFVIMNFDYEQFNRLFFNLIKNSLESIQEKVKKDSKTNKNIDIEIRQRRDYIIINIFDTGEGFKNKKTKDLIKPYYTTKEKGTGLGLSIVDKIVSDHNGSIKFLNHKNGANIQLIFPIK